MLKCDIPGCKTVGNPDINLECGHNVCIGCMETCNNECSACLAPFCKWGNANYNVSFSLDNIVSNDYQEVPPWVYN